MKRSLTVAVLGIALLMLVPLASRAAVPQTINYQGYLTNPAGTPLTGTYTMVFSLCDAVTAGACPWSENQSVVVDKGVFNVTLGAVTPLSVNFNTSYFLDIQVNGEPMSARQALTSVSYAFKADSATQATSATTATSFSGSLSGDVTGSQSSTVVSTVGGLTAANVAAGAVLANNATATNTAGTVVRRDSSGNFSANTITANLSGNASGTAANVTGTVAVANGGTGAASASAGLNNLLPSQTGNSGKVLSTNGTTASWTTPSAASGGMIFSGGSSEIKKDNIYYYSVMGQSSGSTYADGNITLVPVACTASKLQVSILHYQAGDSGSFTATMLLSSSGYPAATALTCTVSNSGSAGTISTCSDLTHTVSIPAGAIISLKIDGSSAVYSTWGPDGAWGLVCQ